MIFDHIGIVVPDIAHGRLVFAQLFGIAAWTQCWDDAVNGVTVQFGRDDAGIAYELVAPLGASSPVANTLKRSQNILNHIAYRVPILEDAADRLVGQGCVKIGDPNPAIAYDNHRIQFLMSPLRFILEIIEAPKHEHIFYRP